MDVVKSVVGKVPQMEKNSLYEPTGHENPISARQLSNLKGRYPGAPRDPPHQDGPARAEASGCSDLLKSFFKAPDTPYFSPEEVANIVDFAQLVAVNVQPVIFSPLNSFVISNKIDASHSVNKCECFKTRTF